VEWTQLDPAEFKDKFASWIEFVAVNHGGTNPRVNEQTSFTPLAKPLADSRVALVTTAGAHLTDQEPFHTATIAGDATFRVIPHDVDLGELRFSHTHYDTTSAEADPNVVLPRDRLNELIQSGRVGSASPVHVGMMGFNPDPTAIADVAAPAVAETLRDEDVDVVIMAPG
jgi:D-proline reductase (dithiol) PrdB